MSSGAQLLWNLKLTVCARETLGMAVVAAAAPAASAACRRNLRRASAPRVGVLVLLFGSFICGNLSFRHSVILKRSVLNGGESLRYGKRSLEVYRYHA